MILINAIKKISKLLASIGSHRNSRQIFQMGVSHCNLMRKNYLQVKNLNELDYKVYSQSGEDGIIDYLLCMLNIIKPKFIEIGVGNYYEANTRFLFERSSCKGFVIDIIKDFEKEVGENVNLWRGDLKIVEKEINSKNILNTLKENDFYENIDLFSLDIDGVDYWVLKELPNEFSKIIVVEYNPYFGDKLMVSVPNINGFQRKKYHYSHLCFGTSIKALINLLNKKGYIFLGSNLLRTNAFFVLEKFKNKINLDLPDINNLAQHVDSHVRESRDKKGKLNFLAGKNRIKEIENCEVIDLSSSEEKLVKIKDIY